MQVYEDRKLVWIHRQEARGWVFRAMCALPVEILVGWAWRQEQDEALRGALFVVFVAVFALHACAVWWAYDNINEAHKLERIIRKTEELIAGKGMRT